MLEELLKSRLQGLYSHIYTHILTHILKHTHTYTHKNGIEKAKDCERFGPEADAEGSFQNVL